jgi:hypothetical protein
MPLLVCKKCGTTFLEYEEEHDAHPTCSRCSLELVEACEWCNEPEKQCRCGKDNIKTE